jgi:hypothetical protein
LETHFFQILRHPKLHLKHDDVKEGEAKPARKGPKQLKPKCFTSSSRGVAKVTDNFLLMPLPPCSSGFVFDNHWVVPYNPYLTMRY